MSKLTENIKLYNPFRNRQALFYYILLSFCILLIYTSLLPIKLNGDTEKLKDISIIAYIFFLFAMYNIGILASRIHLNFITKPFSSCLPNHYKFISIIILIMGLAGSFIFSILYIAMAHITNMTCVYYINTSFSGLFVYFSTILFFLYIKNEYKPYGIFISIIIFYIFLQSILNGDIKFTFSEYISFSTIPFIIISLCMMFVIYRSMTRPGFKRKYFSGNNPFSFEPADLKSAPKIIEARRIKELPQKKYKPDILEKIIFKVIIKTKYLSGFRVIIAKEYCTLDKFFTLTGWYSWIIILIGFYLITATLLLSGYAPFFEDQDNLYFLLKYVLLPAGIFFLCYKVVSGFVPVYHNLLLPFGRHSQFRNNLYLFLIQMIVAMLWLLLVITISWLIKGNIQPVSLDNSDFIYTPLKLSLLLWPLIIIPVLDIFLYFHGNPCSSITMLIFLAVLFALSLYSIFEVNPFYSLIEMTLAIVISIGFFIVWLRRYWFKKDIELLD